MQNEQENQNNIESPLSPFTPERTPELVAEETRQQALVKEHLYPLLLEHSKSIEDAKNMLYATSMAIQQAFQKKIMEGQVKLSKKPLSSLKMDNIIQQSDEFARDRALLELFQEESISTASSLIDGMKMALESFQREESTKRGLDTLATDFL